MVAGGKPLWYIQVFTTFSAFVLTIVFMSVSLSWSKGLRAVVADPNTTLRTTHLLHIDKVVESAKVLIETLTGVGLYFNVGVGFTVVVAGSLFGFLLYKEKVKPIYSLVWFWLVSAFTLVWMVTSIVFFVEVEETAGRALMNFDLAGQRPLTAIQNWGHYNSSSTVIGLIVAPTIVFMFLSFVAYRHNTKLLIFGNANPDNVATENTPGSWFDRKAGAEGGTWEREPVEEEPAYSDNAQVSGLVQRRSVKLDEDGAVIAEATMVDEQGLHGRHGSMTGGWGSWVEDVFDYTF